MKTSVSAALFSLAETTNSAEMGGEEGVSAPSGAPLASRVDEEIGGENGWSQVLEESRSLELWSRAPHLRVEAAASAGGSETQLGVSARLVVRLPLGSVMLKM